MIEIMSNTKFDICLIGAGPYGMPLCAHAKALGKKGIVMGGSLQNLFGIRGKRWEKHVPEVVTLYNDYWVRVSDEETKKGSMSIEGGCYW
jgi:hypothetical protein